MSAEFARLLVDGWVSLGRQNRDSAIAGNGILNIFPDQDQLTTASYISAAAETLAADGPADSPTKIWTHVFSLASTMDQGQIAGPSYWESFAETPGDLAEAASEKAAAFVSASIDKAKAPLVDVGLILVALAAFAIYLKFGGSK